MNRGVIVGNHINLVSKIVLKYAKNKVMFSCCTPLCLEGSIIEGKCYKIKLFIPKELFPETGLKTFHGTCHDEYIRIRIYDLADQNTKIYLYFRIGDKISTDHQMYCLETIVRSDVSICNPVLFMCGTLIRKKYLHRCLDLDNNNASCIKVFIEETSSEPNNEDCHY